MATQPNLACCLFLYGPLEWSTIDMETKFGCPPLRSLTPSLWQLVVPSGGILWELMAQSPLASCSDWDDWAIWECRKDIEIWVPLGQRMKVTAVVIQIMFFKSVLINCISQGMSPFYPSCHIYWYKFIHSSPCFVMYKCIGSIIILLFIIYSVYSGLLAFS